ncbi:hypothetical protein [Kitasatospora kifunensis]|uniref:Uncharacterized protein n=1 Tax=Kitasatospora kifunensis TaxID=58351 RepID=A0A7W7QYS8_KITKI|nr:hypothetical protein [Kitasatospora kifunensis]MBB4922292.1 hypothetical protein [Kitasatospora kifunensis]
MGISLLQGGAAGLVMLIVVLVLRGHLVPRTVLRDLRADRDLRIAEIMHERDTWRAAYETSEMGRHLAEEQCRELLELSRTATHFLTSLPKATGQQGVTAGAPHAAETLASPP